MSATTIEEAEAFYSNNKFAEALQIFQKFAQEGKREAIGKIGACLRGLKRFEEAAKFCQENISLDDCKLTLAICYFEGQGVEKNYEKAERLLRAAAQEGNNTAFLNLAVLYFCRGQYDDEYFWTNEAANTGTVPKAPVRLKRLIKLGRGIPPHRYAEHIAVLKDSADSDDDSQFRLGLHYHYGEYGLPVDHTEAIKWYKRCAEANNVQAMNNIATIYEKSTQIENNFEEAIHWYKIALFVDPMFPTAAINLADMLIKGKGVTKDLTEAHRLLRSVEAQDPNAGAILARLYFEGEGEFASDEKAREYRRIAAESGSLLAMQDLAANSTGEESILWLNKAAEAGDAQSQISLSKYYAERENFVDSLHWASTARSNGCAEANTFLQELGETVENFLFV